MPTCTKGKRVVGRPKASLMASPMAHIGTLSPVSSLAQGCGSFGDSSYSYISLLSDLINPGYIQLQFPSPDLNVFPVLSNLSLFS